jgi:hypothetical protein
VRAVEVEVICSNADEHRHRVETRRSDIDGLELPTWQAVVERHYESWDRRHIVIDTAVKGVEENVADLVAHLAR